MPLWKVYHPTNAFSAEDKQELAEKITNAYAGIPIPKFYAVVIFEELVKGNCFVGGVRNDKFIRFRVDHIARTLPGPILREWWMRTLEEVIAPFIKERGFDWEISIDETPCDLWTLQGEIPPPFESMAEKRWVEENKASPYTYQEKLPAGHFLLTPGVTG